MAQRVLRALLRLYPARARARFGEGLLYGWQTDLARARTAGVAAVAGFWLGTVGDVVRCAVAEQTGGWSMRAFFTVDWRDAWRSLRAAPMVTAFSVASLALGIGGVTALFTILNSLVYKTLPVREPQQLALIEPGSWTNPIWEALRERRQAFAEDAFAWGNERFNLSPTAAADMVDGFWASGRMFEVLGVPAAIGRTFDESDDVRGAGPAGPVAVISYAFWQRRYAGAPDVVGRTILVERVPFTIVGVTPRGFLGPDVGRSFDVALPLGAEPLVMRERSRLDERTDWWMNMMARLRPGDTAASATARLRAIQPAVREATLPEGQAEMREHYLTDAFSLVSAPGGRSPLRSRYQQPLTIILSAVGLVLLIACANVANLLIARASDRRHELTLRLALGATRWRIARQLLVESLCVGAAGAALGVWLAAWGSRFLVAQLSSAALSVDLNLDPDWRVLAFATLVSLAATIVFGVAPALAASRLRAGEVLKTYGRTTGFDRRGLARNVSVAIQMALSLTLAAGAGLFARTLVALETRDLGVDRHAVLLVSANVDRTAAREDDRDALFARMTSAVQAVPGVASAALSYTTPIARAGRNGLVRVPPGSPLTRPQRTTWVNVVSPNWFATMGVRLAAGRDFDARDRAGAPPTVAVNRTFARRFLPPGVDPIGARFSIDGPGDQPMLEVVGLVEDSVYRSVREEMPPVVYLPFAQEGSSSTMTFAIRPGVAISQALTRGVAAAIEREDPATVLTFRTLDEQVGATLTQERVLATVAAFFGGLGLLLAGVGLYGVTSYAVVSRRTEIGIRMALGADAERVVRLVAVRVAWLVGIGIVAGAALSLWAGRYVQTLLYGLEPRDPVTLAAASGLLVVVAAIAAWIPARRASRVDPMVALRP